MGSGFFGGGEDEESFGSWGEGDWGLGYEIENEGMLEDCK